MMKFNIIFFIATIAFGQYDWTDNGVAIRQGVHIEWQRTADMDNNLIFAWSDTRKGGRDVYAQKVDSQGQKLWDVKGNILETSSSNVFVVSNGVLYTPGLDEGCLAGTMRMQVINLALKCGMKVYECSILPQNLLAADEVFITNAVRGINWIGA